MILKYALSVSSIILGAYILISLLLKQPQSHHSNVSEPQAYSICFHSKNQLSQSQEIQRKIDSLKSKSNIQSPIVTKNYKANYIQHKGLQISKLVNQFFTSFHERKEDMKNYFHLLKTVKLTELSLRNCSGQSIMQWSFSQQKCHNFWLQYLNCSTRLSYLKNQLIIYFDQKQIIEDKIKQKLMQNKKQKNKQSSNQINQKERMYKNEEKRLEVEQRNIEMNAKYVIQKIVNIKYNLGVAQNQTQNSRLLYHQCTQHRHQFKLCQQMSQEIKNLGYGTVENLGQRVLKKRVYIAKIQNMIIEQQSNNPQKQNLHILYNRSLAQYRKIHKVFAQIKVKMDKNCGCSESQQQKLYGIWQKNVQQQKKTRVELLKYEQKQKQIKTQLAMIRERRRKLSSQFLQITNEKVKNPIEEQKIIIEEMEKLEKQKIRVNNQILEYEHKITELSKNCAQIRWQLSTYVQNVQQLSSCINKFKLYRELKNALKNNKQRINLNIYRKQDLFQAVRSFDL